MTLTNTFDTHIKAISTAEEWAEYKAMIMNKSSKEIATAIVNEDHTPMDNEEAIVAYSKWINQHTNQTLQELKAKIKKVEAGDNPQYQEAEYIRIEYVITLIDEAINE